jgi:hypothetical protein
MLGRHKRSLKPTIGRPNDHYIVSFTDNDGRQHETPFDTRHQARSFARKVRRWPAEESFDRKAVDALTAEYTGSLARPFGQECGILPPK